MFIMRRPYNRADDARRYSRDTCGCVRLGIKNLELKKAVGVGVFGTGVFGFREYRRYCPDLSIERIPTYSLAKWQWYRTTY